MSSFDQNPENGGTPAMASQPTMKVPPVTGIHFCSPPMRLHVLLVVHPVDHRSGPEEEEGLEEGVGDHVEDGGRVGPRSDGQEHVAELADGGVGEDLLDVVLGAGDGGREQGGEHAHPGDERGHVGGGAEHRVDPHHEEDAGGDHGGGMDQGRHRRGALHGVGQPHVEGQLGRLARRPQEEEEADGGGGVLGGVAEGGQGGHVVERADGAEDQEHGDHEPEVADAVGDERLLARRRRRGPVEPEGDEEVGAGAHALPAQEGEQEVVRHHQHEHGEGEQVQVDEELGELLVAVHVADGVEVDERAHAGDEQGHGDRQGVDQEGHVDVERRPSRST